jgi:hypothetical protein
MQGSTTLRKQLLTESDLQLDIYKHSPDHDDLLFLAMTFTGFHGLLRLGELLAHDNLKVKSTRKACKRHSVRFHSPRHFYLANAQSRPPL